MIECFRNFFRTLLLIIRLRFSLRVLVLGLMRGELKRNFVIDNKSYKNINCEFHYKLENMDDQYGGKHFKNRIYVGFLKSEEINKVLIAHIGEHL